MRRASPALLLLWILGCARAAPDQAVPRADEHALVGAWESRRVPSTGLGLRFAIRVDSVVNTRPHGALTFYMVGNASLHAPDAWGTLEGAVCGDTVTLVLPGGASGAPGLTLDGRQEGDTIHVSAFVVGPNSQVDADRRWLLVRLAPATAPGGA